MNARMYNLVMYSELEIYNYITALQNSSGKNISQVQYAYICHDRDTDKKEHWHLFLRFPEAVKSDRLEKILTLCNLSISYLNYVKTDINFLAYLTHSTKESIGVKASYEFSSIISNIPDLKELWQKAIEKTNQPTRAERKIQEFTSIMATLYDIIDDTNTIIDFSSLMKHLNDNGYYKEMEFCINKCYAIKETFKDNFKANSIKHSTSILKHENRAKLSDLQDQFEEAKKQADQLNEIGRNINLYENFND